MEILELTACQLAQAIAARKISVRDAAFAVFEKIARAELQIGAFSYLNEKALTQAKELDEQLLNRAELPPLFGVPYALKDNMDAIGFPTMAGSKLLANHLPERDALVEVLLRQAGGVLLGKANMDEFAMGSSTATSCHHPTYNPHDITRSPGGTSGGSAAAVASQEAFFALGTDTGGSIRQPAAFCGVVGLKPTFGAIPNQGVVPCAASLDVVGTLTKDVTDSALIFSVLSGRESTDKLQKGVKGLRVGLPQEYFAADIRPELRKQVEKAAEALAQQGALVEECSLPYSQYGLVAYHVIGPVEVNRTLRTIGTERNPETRSRLMGEEAKRRLLTGAYFAQGEGYETYYYKACQIRHLLREEFQQAFQQYDVLLTPVTRDIAFRMDEAPGDPLEMYLNDLLLAPINLAGNCAISIPYGKVAGMPAAVQLIAGWEQEARLFQVGKALEESLA